MTIDEAIKQVEVWASHPPGVVFSSEIPAAKLLIEAGKRLQEHRISHMDYTTRLLPGETPAH